MLDEEIDGIQVIQAFGKVKSEEIGVMGQELARSLQHQVPATRK